MLGVALGALVGAVVGKADGACDGRAVGGSVGSGVGLAVTMQLVSLLASATKPSKHAQVKPVPSSFSQCVLLVSQPCEPLSQGCWVGIWVGA